MKKIFFLTFFIPLFSMAQNISFVNEKVGSKPIIKRKPAEQKIVEPSSVSQELEEKGDTSFSIQWSNHLLKGSYNLGKASTDAEFNSYSLELLIRKPTLMYGLAFDSIKNTHSIKINQLGLSIGAYKLWHPLQVSLYGGVLGSNYTEKSSMQNVNVSSIGVHATAAVDIFLGDNFYLNANYKYMHLMFTDGLKYWGDNPRSDMVIDVSGLGLGFGWRF